MVIPEKEGYFRAHILAAVSPQFFGWVTGIGEKMQIEGPLSVRKEYREYLARIMGRYNT